MQHEDGWSEDEFDVSHITIYSWCTIFHFDYQQSNIIKYMVPPIIIYADCVR